MLENNWINPTWSALWVISNHLVLLTKLTIGGDIQMLSNGFYNYDVCMREKEDNS